MTHTTTTSLLDAALGYARRAWHVFPCRPHAKRPATEHGSQDATLDPEQIRRWWADQPDANIGIATGASQLVVIDIDETNDGHRSLAKLEDIHGPLPETLTALTGNGQHHYFAGPPDVRVRNSTSKLAQGIDIRADGGYVVAPPSIHPSGAVYEWLDPDAPVAALPRWVVDQATRPERPAAPETRSDATRTPAETPSAAWAEAALDREATAVADAPEGTRNEQLNRAAWALGQIVAGGHLTEAAVTDQLTQAATRCGLPPAEAARTIRSGLTGGRQHPRHPRARDASVRAGSGDNSPDPGDPPRTPGVTTSGQIIGFTELSNARRLIRAHGGDLRYVANIGWHHWDGRRWRYDDSGEAVRRLKGVVDDLRDTVWAVKDPKAQDKCLTAWRATQRWSHIAGALTLASSEADIVAHVDQLDTDPWLLNCENGTLDLRTGTLHPHDPGQLITKLAPVAYDPGAPCPTWERFLDEVFAGDTALIDYVQRAAGWSITGRVEEHVLPICHGTGSNGKSTFLNTVRRLLGDYGVQLAPDLLLASTHEPHPTGLTDLRGARFAVSVEVDQGRRLAESLVKMLTGGENIRARRMRQDFFEFTPTHSLWLAVNHLPTVRGADDGIWRRIHVVPFTVTIPEDDRDPRLPDRLWTERAGILRWLVDGTRAWAEHGLDPPGVVRVATGHYRESQDHLGAFITARCAVEPDARVRTKDLRSDYERWCAESEEEALNRNLWGRLLTHRGHPTDTTRHHRVGLRLVTDDDIFSALTTEQAGDATEREENGDRARIARSSVPSLRAHARRRGTEQRADRARAGGPTTSDLAACKQCGKSFTPTVESPTVCQTCLDPEVF